MPRTRWRMLLTPAAGGAENMALDEALMSRARETGEWTLRVYSWSRATISFGRNEAARRHYDPERIGARDLAVVRRPTGGRAILHDREITYSVTAPAADAGDLRASYDRINTLLLTGLARLGVDARVAERETRGVTPGPAPCFAEPWAGELTLGGRKLAGSAQWRSSGAMLQHGSILVEDDQSVLTELWAEPRSRIPAPATLASALGRPPTPEELYEALAYAVREIEDPCAESLIPDDRLRADAASLVVHYADEAWTWSR